MSETTARNAAKAAAAAVTTPDPIEDAVERIAMAAYGPRPRPEAIILDSAIRTELLAAEARGAAAAEARLSAVREAIRDIGSTDWPESAVEMKGRILALLAWTVDATQPAELLAQYERGAEGAATTARRSGGQAVTAREKLMASLHEPSGLPQDRVRIAYFAAAALLALDAAIEEAERLDDWRTMMAEHPDMGVCEANGAGVVAASLLRLRAEVAGEKL